MTANNILIDTRGGSDLTSVGSAISAGSIIIVTEADKPSWDMGRVLINAIEDAETKLDIYASKLGFVLNKNVLPSESIEMFLRKEWGCPHLSTIDLDKEIITNFQQDKIPVVENDINQFSYSIYQLIEKIFLNENWNNDVRERLYNKFEKSRRQLQKLRFRSGAQRIIDRLSILFRVYVIGIISSIIIYLEYQTK